MPPRFYCTRFSTAGAPGAPGQAVLEGDELHHLRSVRRLGPGDAVELFDGRGRLAECTFRDVDRRRAELQVTRVTESPPPRVRLTVGAAIAKGHRMDWLVEKTTELGAWALWPLVAERSTVTSCGQEKRRGWLRRAVEAAKQCGRLWLPEIADPMSVAEAIARLEREPTDLLLLADPSDEAALVADALSNVGRTNAVPGGLAIAGFVGPEGGFTDEEAAALRAAGAQMVRLGPHILRIETAAVALAAAVAAWGGFGGGPMPNRS